MVFSGTKNVQLPNLIFNDVRISFVDNHKHLGLTLSSNGNWKEHISNLCRSASQLLGMMRTLKFRLKRDSLNQIYVSYLRPVLEYASVVWDNCTKRVKRKSGQNSNRSCYNCHRHNKVRVYKQNIQGNGMVNPREQAKVSKTHSHL